MESTLYGFRFRDFDRRRERLADDGRRCYDIKQLWQRSHEILNLALLGYKQVDIAKMLDIAPQTVCDTINSTLGKEAIAERRQARDEEYEGLRDEVMELTKKGLAIYNKILSAEEDPLMPTTKLGKETADTVVLELSGLRVPTKIDSRSVHHTLTTEELEEFKRRGVEAAKASGRLVEVDYETKKIAE